MQIQTILDQIDLGSMALPEFQRGYVWNREQVRRFMNSLYRRYPVGSLLVWVTKTETANPRGEVQLQPGSVKLILDGQQRITSLYGIIRGKPPEFFDGNVRTFTGLYFNMEEENFEFYSAPKMGGDPLWIDVTDLIQPGNVGKYIGRLYQDSSLDQEKAGQYTDRLNTLASVRTIDFHIEEVTGEDKTVDVVVDIFNEVNSGGTKLSKGDLALAKICAEWPDARNQMKARLDTWLDAGFNFKLEWLLRCVNTILTGEALFSALAGIDAETFQNGLNQAEKAINTLLNMISARLGLDHERVLGSRYSFPVMARYLMERGGRLEDYRERDKLLYWYVHTILWGRFAGSTESKINQDLGIMEEETGALDRLIGQLRQERGNLELQPADFWGWSRGARFYPMMYMLTRAWHARDWGTGIELTNHLLGKLNQLQVHHIFPKDPLYKNGYKRPEVNAIANFTFLTQETNLKISNRLPEQYFLEIVENQPGALESHWIPMDRELWKVENYSEFLNERRKLLAKAANEFLNSLLVGDVPEVQIPESIFERPLEVVASSFATEVEEKLLLDTNIWVVEQGLPEGEMLFEVIDPETEAPLAILDLVWENGLQEGYSQPVALLIDESREVEEIANRAGFRYFTDVEVFRQYVQREILALEMET